MDFSVLRIARLKWVAVLAAVFLAMTGCAPKVMMPLETMTSAPLPRSDDANWLQDLLKDEQRLYDVYGRLVTSNADICGGRFVPSFGFRMWSSEDFDEGKRTAAIEAFHVDGRLQVYAVAAGQPAEAAGIRPGDILTHIDGQPLQEGAAGRAQYAEAVTTGLMKRGVVSFEFLNGQEKKRARLRAVKACPYAIAMAVGSEPNAATDGATVYVSSGMLKFVVSDAELAIVLGHELAHAIRQHPLKNRGEQTGRSLAKAVMGDVYDATVGIGSAVWSIVAGVPEERRNSISFEMVADELGLYLAARSGYDVSVAPHFWTRLISSYNEASSDHPTSADRFQAMQATAEEIAAKRAQGEKLSPPLDPGS